MFGILKTKKDGVAPASVGVSQPKKAQSSEEVFQTALADFRRSVEITRDVRFQANLRLGQRQRGSAYIVSLLSLYVIFLSLLPNIFELDVFQTQLLLSFSIVLSVFVIFTSLIDGAQNFYHQGELLHQCARKLATIYHESKLIDYDKDPVGANATLKSLQDRYRHALDECPINHDNMDFFEEMATKPYLFTKYYNPKLKLTFVIWNKVKSTVMRRSWMIMHLAAFASITLATYVFVIQDAERRTDGGLLAEPLSVTLAPTAPS